MKKILSIFAAALALAGCTETDLAGSHAQDGLGTQAGDMPLMARMRTVDKPMTRAPYVSDTITVDTPLIANVIAFNQTKGDPMTGDYSNVFHNGTMTFTSESNEVGFKIPQFYPGNKAVFLAGFYPNALDGTDGTPNVWTVDTSAKKVVANIPGNQDLMTAKAQRTTKEEAKGVVGYKTLVFKHLLTKLVFKIQGVPTAWGNVKSIELVSAGASKTAGLKNVCTVDVEGLAALNADISTTNPTFTQDQQKAAPAIYKASSTYDLDADGKIVESSEKYTYTDDPYDEEYELSSMPMTVGYSIAPPIMAGNNEYYYVKVKTEHSPSNPNTEEERILRVQSLFFPQDDAGNDPVKFEEYTQGYQFYITINFSKSEIKAIANVIKWNEMGTSMINIEGNMVSKNLETPATSIESFEAEEHVEPDLNGGNGGN